MLERQDEWSYIWIELTKLTEFCDELELLKLDIIFLETLVSRELFFGTDKIRKLGLRNSWRSYLDLQNRQKNENQQVSSIKYQLEKVSNVLTG